MSFPRKELPRAAGVALLVNLFLLLLKGVVGILISSLSILSDAMDSFTESLSSFITLLSLKQVSRPPDEDHHYGHGKFDPLGSLVEGTIIFAFAMIIFIEGTKRIMGKEIVKLAEIGIAVMLLNSIIKILLARYLSRLGREADSLSLLSAAQHYKLDFYNDFGIIFGLFLIRLTHFYIIDPIVAIIIGFMYLKTSVTLLRSSIHQIVDKAPPGVEEKVEELLMEHYPQLTGFHKLRIRKAGNELQMDMHIQFPNGISLEEAHSLSEHLEEDIKELFPSSIVVIHMEPDEKNV
jgi:cation diffusion facilitator family transporter